MPTNEAALASLKDWRVWALACVVLAITGAISGGLRLNGSALAGGAGGALGLLIAMRMNAMRRCRQCQALVS